LPGEKEGERRRRDREKGVERVELIVLLINQVFIFNNTQ
jgi:hypothetical protein